ncbi:helix-turn-helix domain-containing protein [Pseudorhodoplanes sinuspersici]|uniref:DNA-binding protein n=1 Tax=Pseudorhodoplanes sinuspersici TaxID=1235591 RepID=A0A1W6ZP35_9HYPH|nr:helix-turn-helix domain-containing protein [Pseudorhodoplanes sinuspersici]ARP99131.1 DNA-binding protein [Pseudorhodoplanes sinuspersici]RKE69216.1 excisionase family DNA binding protein [Pseudorhodoplanes sinuspersici]
MSDVLVTVEQAADALNLHPKTILRYIHEGRLPATRVGKSYRIARTNLDAFAGVASGKSEATAGVRTTCIVDIPDVSAEAAERTATFLHAAAMAGDGGTPPLHLQTAFDPPARSMKVVMIGSPSDVSKLLEMLQLQLRARS